MAVQLLAARHPTTPAAPNKFAPYHLRIFLFLFLFCFLFFCAHSSALCLDPCNVRVHRRSPASQRTTSNATFPLRLCKTKQNKNKKKNRLGPMRQGGGIGFRSPEALGRDSGTAPKRQEKAKGASTVPPVGLLDASDGIPRFDGRLAACHHRLRKKRPEIPRSHSSCREVLAFGEEPQGPQRESAGCL